LNDIVLVADQARLSGRTVIVYDDLSVRTLSAVERFFWIICFCSCLRRIIFKADTDSAQDVLIRLHPVIQRRNPAMLALYQRAISGYNHIVPRRYIDLDTSGAPIVRRVSSAARVHVGSDVRTTHVTPARSNSVNVGVTRTV